MIAALPVPTGGKVAEIGVRRGDFSKTLINTLKPREFFAFDIFTCHQVENWNGLTGHQLFDGLTQRQYYEREMAPYLDVIRMVEGNSQETLRSYTDGSFDLVYVDAAHEYDAVKADAEYAVEMTAKSGFLPQDKPNDKSKGTESGTSEPQGQELGFSARISLDRTQMQVGSDPVNLSPGMAVTVEIKTGSRTLMSYLLSPLLRYRQESLRER